jgi:hypothetical protein
MARVPTGHGKIEQIGQFGDSCPAAKSAVLVDGLHPRVGGDVKDGQLHRLGDVEADRVLDAVAAQRVQELVGASCRIGPGQHGHPVDGIDAPRGHRQLRQGQVQDLEVVGGGVGPGVAGAQDPRQGLGGVVQPGAEGEEPVPLFVGGSCVLLVGMGIEQGGVKVQRHVATLGDGVETRFPHGRTHPGAGLADGGEQGVVDGVDHPERGGDRGDGSEDVCLQAQAEQIGQGIPPAGDGHRQVRDHLAGVMASPPLAHRGQRLGRGVGEP